jgi:DNA (cytosine-5)-methyltransferase 1
MIKQKILMLDEEGGSTREWRGLTHVSLFSGIGGIDLAAEWAGFKTILFVEKDNYCQQILRKHWPNVPIIGDIRDVRKKTMANATQLHEHGSNNQRKESKSQIQEFRNSNSTGDIPVTLLTGGFPCQPFSVAGKRRGKDDDRYLWPEMLRVIKEFQPTWCVCENVIGIINMALDTVCSDPTRDNTLRRQSKEDKANQQGE